MIFKSHHPEYSVWYHMIRRCYSSDHEKFHCYGGRGIAVCERWMTFENFLADLGPRPTDQHELERENNDGNYEPGNCVWATHIEQMNNTRKSLFIDFSGKRQTATQWGRELGLSGAIISNRIRAGWPG